MDRVILVGNYVPDEQQSMLRFARALRSALSGRIPSVSLWQPPTFFGRWGGVDGRGIGRWLGYIDKLLFGPVSLLCWRIRYPRAVWHILDQGNAFYAWLLPRRRTLLTVHDVFAVTAWRQGKLRASGALLQRLNAFGIRRVGLAVAVSPQTATALSDFRNCGDGPPIVPNALNRNHCPVEPAVAHRRLLSRGIPTDRPFIFHVSGNQWYKNRIGLIRIYGHFRSMVPDCPWRLLLAGKPWTDELRLAIQNSPFASDIHEAGTLDDETLDACYSLAKVVVFPSHAEGFGWPLAEAQACGALVVASARQPLMFVGGEGARYSDPADEPGFARTVIAALSERESLRALALVNTRRFAPDPWANAYVDLYRSLS